MKKKYLATDVCRSLKIYKLFLIENNLENDSNSIDVESLMEYVDNEIDKDDMERLRYLANRLKMLIT